MTTDDKGHTVPASTDAPARSALTDLSLSIRDIVYVADTTARTAAVTALSPSASDPLYVHRADAGDGLELEVTNDGGTTWRTIPAGPIGWTAYTPAWTSNGTAPALGNGTLAGGYQRIGRTVWFTILLTMGSTTTYGTGAYSLSLPFTSGTLEHIVPAFVGDATSGTSYSPGCIGYIAASHAIIGIYAGDANSGQSVSPTNPQTFESGDRIWVGGCYQAAAS